MPRSERAAYKKQVLGLSSKPAPSLKRLQNCGYFGRTVGSPPGLPGGGITGVLPASGVGARISGSTPGGGHSTPSDRASLSPSGSLRWPVVVPSGTTVPRCGAGCVGVHSLAREGAGGAVCAGGVVGAGGAWALAAPDAAITAHESKRESFIRIRGNRRHAWRFRKNLRICG